MFLLIFNEQRVPKFIFVLVLTYYVKPHLFVILTAIGWFIVNIQTDLFWHRCLERQAFGTPRINRVKLNRDIHFTCILRLLNNTCVKYNFKSVHVSNLFWSREYNSDETARNLSIEFSVALLHLVAHLFMFLLIFGNPSFSTNNVSRRAKNQIFTAFY
jgi:hypothetical protein